MPPSSHTHREGGSGKCDLATLVQRTPSLLDGWHLLTEDPWARLCPAPSWGLTIAPSSPVPGHWLPREPFPSVEMRVPSGSSVVAQVWRSACHMRGLCVTDREGREWQEEGSAHPGAGTAAKVDRSGGPVGGSWAPSNQTGTGAQTSLWAQREPAVLPRSCGTEAPALADCSFIKTLITSEMIDGLEGHQPAVVELIRVYYLLNHLIQTKKKSLVAQKVMSESVKTLY